jgi:glycosyltransferase involved in cell wall biosynthesis
MAALVRHVHTRITPGGGPQGYLHNLQGAIGDRKDWGDVRLEVTTLPPMGSIPGSGWVHRTVDFLAQIPGLRRLNYELQGEFALRFKHAVRGWRANYAAVDRGVCEQLLTCDLLVVHDTFLAERLVACSPRESRAKVALVTHAPVFYAHQIAGDILPDAREEEWRDEQVVRSLRRRELATMQSVRAVIWPFTEAQEGYGDWAVLVAAGDARNAFARTGVPRPATASARESTRSSWGVAESDRVALFMGRPHPDKGFGRFLEWAEAARRKNSGWTFVFAGQEPKHSRRDLSAIRCLGYQSDNGGAYLAADLVVIPNRHAYLDIGLLECLALGVPVAATAVGGHRCVLRLLPPICTIADGEPGEVWSRLEQAAVEMARPESRQARVDLWMKLFSPGPFVEEHLAVAAALLYASDERSLHRPSP